MNTDTPTPRTDAASWRENNSPVSEVVLADFARTLERELVEANARIKEFENATVWCGFCKHEGRGYVPSKPGAYHLDGAYNYVPLCEKCEKWLENETIVTPLDLPNGI